MLKNIELQKLILLFVIIAALGALSIEAQNENQFEKLTIKDGLSSNDIWGAVQDQYGFLWIATKDGLNVYDGYKFKIYKNSTGDSFSLPSNNCNTVYEDSNHDIWIGTKVGLAKFNRENETFVNYQYTINNSNLANNVWKILEDSKKNLWITTNDGPFIFDRTKKEFVRFDIMTIDNKLAPFSSNATILCETKNGDLFIATKNFGLVKFDYSSQIFIQQNLNNGSTILNFSNIYDMSEDKGGNLWLATISGLYKLDTRNITIVDLTPYKKFEVTENDMRNGVIGVYKDRSDNMWIGTSTHGIYAYETKNDEFQSFYATNSTNYIGPFYEDRFGIIWSCTSQGLWKYDLDKKPFDLVVPSRYLKDEINPIIFSFMQSKKYAGQMWLGSSNGLYLYNKSNRSIQSNSLLLNRINSPEKLSISSLTEDDEHLWLGSNTKGLFKLNLNTNKLENFVSRFYDNNSINIDRINTLLDSKENRIFIGTDFGINVINKITDKITSIPSLLSRHYNKELSQSIAKLSHNVQSVASILQVGDFANISKDFVLTKDENIIISAVGEGVFQGNMVDYGWLESETGDTIWSNNDLYSTFHAGGAEKNRIKIGLLKLKKGRYKLKYISDDSHSAQSFNAQLPEDTLSWGIAMYSLNDDIYDHLEKILAQDDSTTYLDGHIIRKLILTSDNSIWAATSLGLSRIDPKSFLVKNYRKQDLGTNSLSSDLVNDIVEDLNGNIWIATEYGLNKLDPKTDEFLFFGEKNGLPTNNLKSIQIDSVGDLWVGSSNGVSKIEISDSDNNHIINYDVKDGLQGYDFIPTASYKDSDGRLYFSGTEGFNVFLPGKSNNTLPYVAINNVLISNKSIKDIDPDLLVKTSLNQITELDLPHNQNDLSFEFSSIHFSRPDKNRLQYKMEGVDENWILSDRKFATYTNLDPGDYVFNIKASNGDGIWNENSRKIYIHISPPWYNNWTAYSIYAALFFGLLYETRKFELGRQKKNAFIKETRLKIETAEANAKAADSEKRALQIEFDHKKKELDEARELQLSMLPRELPQMPNLDIAVYMKTATEVGGDYYDFAISDDGTLNVALGDATGHGMQAGTLVTLIKGLFTSEVSNKEILNFFNDTSKTIKEINLGRLMMAFSLLKLKENMLQFSSAGLPPMYIYRKNSKSIEEVDKQGMPLGAMRNFKYNLYETELSVDDCILLLSDGYPELENNNNEQIGYVRLQNQFLKMANKKPEEIIEYFKKFGSEWVAGSDPDDDVTFVVIKVK